MTKKEDAVLEKYEQKELAERFARCKACPSISPLQAIERIVFRKMRGFDTGPFPSYAEIAMQVFDDQGAAAQAIVRRAIELLERNYAVRDANFERSSTEM